MSSGRSSRSGDDHVHADAWSKDDHHRYEDRIARELQILEGAIDKLTMRVTIMVGGIGVVAFLTTIAAPFVRAFLNLDAPPGQ